MKITIVGLGAVGALLAARLQEGGHQVAALARGATLQAVQRDGLKLQRGDRVTVHRLTVSDDPQALPEAELVVLALKGPALAASATQLAPLWQHGATVLPAMNGVPWWFLAPGLVPGLTPDDAALSAVDPTGAIAAALPLAQVLGCVVHLASSCPAPGHVQHGFGERLIVGEPAAQTAADAGAISSRVRQVASALAAAGFEAEASTDIRRDIWFKLWGNMTMNPVSALTGATVDRILDDPLVLDFMVRAMQEAAAIGARIGCPIEQSAVERIGLARQLGAFRTSMLQDTEAARRIELDALVGVVREIGTRLGLPTPNIDTLFGLTRLMGRERGLYP